jgi:acetyltransferase
MLAAVKEIEMSTTLLAGGNEVAASPSEPDVPWPMRDGISVVIRPIRASDETMMVSFHRSLSSDSVRKRYFGIVALSRRIEHNRLTHICHPDPDDVVLVAEIATPSVERAIVAVARLSKAPGRPDGEVALVVSDSFQQCGLGTELFRRLIQAAKDSHLTRLCARVLAGNVAMLRLCAKMGMRIPNFTTGGEVKAVLELSADDGYRSETCA